jgi:hypothetical protein
MTLRLQCVFLPVCCCWLHSQLLREGAVVEEDIMLQPNDMLVPVHTYDRLPAYYIFAGAVTQWDLWCRPLCMTVHVLHITA